MKISFLLPSLFCMMQAFLHAQNCSNICIDFDPTANPTSDYVESTAAPVASNANFTIEARFLMPTTNTGTGQRFLIGLGGTTNRLELLEMGGLLRIVRQSTTVGSALSSLSTMNFRDGAWHHLAATRNGSLLNVYLDGSLIWTNSAFTGNMAITTFRVGAPAMTGALANNTWDGLIDEVRVWNTVRTSAQIAANARCGLQGNEAGLALYYRFQQGVAGGNNAGVTVATDQTANANHGQLGDRFALTGNNSNWVCGDQNFQSCSSACAADFLFSPDDCGRVAFTNTSTATGTLSWNFGHPAGGAANTSTQANPTYQYPAPGTYNVCLTLTSATGASCTTCKNVVITSTDNQPPSVSCTNRTVVLSATPPSVHTLTVQEVLGAPVQDNCCSNVSVSIVSGQTQYTCADACAGPRTIVVQATDCVGNVSSCTAQVTVLDQTPPIALCKNISVTLGSGGSVGIMASDVDNGSTDNCAIDQRTLSTTSFTCPPAGEPCPYVRTVTLTVRDICGNTATCTSVVTIQELVPPIARCKNATIFLGPTGTATLSWTDIDNGSSDACHLANLSVGPINYSCPSATQPCPYTTTVVLTARDCSNNTASCTAQLTVSDNLPPVFVNCPANISVSATAGQTSAAVTWVAPTATDNCSGVILTSSHQPGAIFPCGNTTVIYTARDGCGNTATCSFTVTVNCGSCQCGFGQMAFNTPGLPAPSPVICGQSTFNLGCPDGKTYTVTGSFSCAPATCDAGNLTWNIVNAAGVNIANGTFTAGAFSIPVNGSVMTTAGTYTMTISGTCGGTTCTCVIRFVSEGCGGCACGAFTNISLNQTIPAPPVGLTPLQCGGSFNMPCPVAGKNYEIRYFFGCTPNTPNCVPTNMAYSIVNISTGTVVVPLTTLGGVVAVPINGNDIAANGTYEVTIQGNCGGNLCQCKMRLVVNCGGGCECGFSNIAFKDPTSTVPQQLNCGNGVSVRCPAANNYTLSGMFNCSPASCAATNLGWQILNSGGTAVASGTFTAGSFSITFPGSAIATPGIYTMILTGTCGQTVCTCRVLIKVTCGLCECGAFTGLMIQRKTTGPLPVKISPVCGQSATMPCPVKGHNWNLMGSFACVGDCDPSFMAWNIANSAGTTVASGSMSGSPFNIYFSGNSISTPGTYTLTLSANCGTQRCSCVVRLIVNCPPEPVDTLCGKAVVTCFPGWNSNNYLLGINAASPTFGIVDIRDRSTATPGAYWAAESGSNIYHPASWNYSKTGLVFGIAIDGVNNFYLTSTTLYGCPNGTFNPFGPAGPAGIYKVNPAGVITNFITTGPFVSGNNQIPNSGSGLGNICYDADHDQMFVTNFSDGMIYRIKGGVVIDRFDPFTTTNTPSTSDPDFVRLDERTWGIAYNRLDKRLYFGRWREDRGRPNTAIFNEIWSVGINSGSGLFSAAPCGLNTFCGNDRLEILLPDHLNNFSAVTQRYSNPVSDLAFSNSGRMLLAERSMAEDCGDATKTKPSSGNWWQYYAHQSRVLEYEKSGITWALTPGHAPSLSFYGLKFSIGNTANSSNSAGGIDYGYESFKAKPTLCDNSVWMTADYMNPPGGPYYGLQGNDATGGGVFNGYVIDYDGLPGTDDKLSQGDVEIFKCLSCLETPPCDSISASILPVTPNSGQRKDCCYAINIQNGVPTTFASVNISVGGAILTVPANVTPSAGWSIGGFVSGSSVNLQHSTGYVPTGSFTIGIICLVPTAPDQTITLNFLDELGNSLCDTTFKVKCAYCLEVFNDSLKCNQATGQLSLDFCIKNVTNPAWTAQSLIISGPVGTTITPPGFSINVPPGGTFCGTVNINIPPGTNLDYGCFTFTLHEGNVIQGQPPLRCCMVDKCYKIPDCCPHFATAMPVDTSGGDCCWKFTVNQPAGTAQFVTIHVIPNSSPVEISSVTNTGGWDINALTTQSITFSLDPPANLPATTTTPTVCFDVPDGSPRPQQLEFVWSTRESILCYDTLEIDCDPYSECASVDSVRLVCNPGGGQTYTIKVMNNTEPPVTVTHIAVVNAMPAGSVPNPTIIPILGGLPPGGMTQINIPVNGAAGTEVCFNLNLYQQTGPQTFRDCCVTEVKHCVTLRTCIPTLHLASMFPNPTAGNITLQFDETGSVPEVGVRLLDLAGRVLYEANIPEGTQRYEIAVPERVQGMFFVELLEGGKRVWTGKAVKQ